MKTNKVKGFTLVELIVVIAIIGVLAAILVPSMLGYVKKSNIAAANSNAKTIYNCAATACADCDTAGVAIGTDGDAIFTYDDAAAITKNTGDDFNGFFAKAVGNVGANTTNIQIKVVDGAVTETACKKGNYWGRFPTATDDSNATTAIELK